VSYKEATVTASPETNFSETQARRLESVYSQLMTLLHQPYVAQRLRTAPDNDEWSALQVLGHLVEMIPYWLGHCRTLIAAHEPPHFGRTLDAPERLAAVEPDTLKQPEALVSLLEAEIQAAAKTLRQLTPAERHKTGIHVKRGEMTVDEILEQFIVAHAEDHLVQVRAALQA
jgi:uncharacterized damage-inducible protein DinB